SLHLLEVVLALKLVEPPEQRLAPVDGLDSDLAVAADLHRGFQAPSAHVVGVEVEASAPELQVPHHVIDGPLVVVLEPLSGRTAGTPVMEAQDPEGEDQPE